jgi:hypothetical protein
LILKYLDTPQLRILEEIWFQCVCYVLEMQLSCQLKMIGITIYLLYYAKCGAYVFTAALPYFLVG